MVKRPRRRKHTPLRSCVVCRLKIDKRQLTRLVYDADSGLIIDPSGKRDGRGAYLCSRPSCWQTAIESDVLNRALNSEISESEKQVLTANIPDLQTGG